VATLDMAVRAAEERAGPPEDAGTATDPESAPAGPEARAEEIRIERSRAGLEWGIIGLLVGLAADAGAALVRRT